MSFAFRTTAAALVSLAVVAAPVAARPYYGHGGYYRGHHHYNGGIGLGGALLGAAIIGGIAIAASSDRRDRDYRYDDGPPPPVVYGEAAPPLQIVDGRPDPVLDCTRAVEDTASQRGGRARVTGIDRVDLIDGGANVLGYVEIDNGGDYAITRTGFSCRAAYGRVTGIRLG